MTEEEGVIQFAYTLEPGAATIATPLLAELRAWRSVLRDLELLGEDPQRYGGFGYGNLSLRCSRSDFVITASQSSGETTLEARDIVQICDVDLATFHVKARGARPPSSESLTHAMLYAADDAVHVVFHVHSPEIWNARNTLDLPATAADVPYGTPAMAEAVKALMDRQSRRPLLFVTAGHEDGVFAAGATLHECGAQLVSCLARARALDSDSPAGQTRRTR
ncbi:MAG: class II aldolase/adducin family protein [Pseudomonadota bacterium]